MLTTLKNHAAFPVAIQISWWLGPLGWYYAICLHHEDHDRIPSRVWLIQNNATYARYRPHSKIYIRNFFLHAAIIFSDEYRLINFENTNKNFPRIWAPSQYKNRLSRYGISITKIRLSGDRLIFIMMGVPILTGKTLSLYWDRPLGFRLTKNLKKRNQQVSQCVIMTVKISHTQSESSVKFNYELAGRAILSTQIKEKYRGLSK